MPTLRTAGCSLLFFLYAGVLCAITMDFVLPDGAHLSFCYNINNNNKERNVWTFRMFACAVRILSPISFRHLHFSVLSSLCNSVRWMLSSLFTLASKGAVDCTMVLPCRVMLYYMLHYIYLLFPHYMHCSNFYKKEGSLGTSLAHTVHTHALLQAVNM